MQRLSASSALLEGAFPLLLAPFCFFFFFAVPYSPFQVMVFCPGHMLWGSVRAALLLLRNPIICKLQRLNPALNLCSANASSS